MKRRTRVQFTGSLSDIKDSDFVKSGWCGNRPKCVTVAMKADGVAVRDSKDESKKTLFFTHDEWDAFKKGIRNGEF